jgi:uncharacterized Zn finger protein
MNWYRGGWGFPPYVPAAERRARALRAIAALAKQPGRRAAEPVLVQRRAIATTFWGKAWCDNLERYMDFVNRLPRGRTYVRNGSVIDLEIGAGRIRALVAGSDVYTVTVDIAALSRVRWKRLAARSAGRIGSLVALLRGELPDEVLAALVDGREGLFPEPRDIRMRCSCPDAARMCKHVAAVLYGVGARLDTRPELFFTLRQIDQSALVARAAAGGAGSRAGGRGKRIAPERVAGVFGIDIEDTAPPVRPPKRAASSAPGRGRNSREPVGRGGAPAAGADPVRRVRLPAAGTKRRGGGRPARS